MPRRTAFSASDCTRNAQYAAAVHAFHESLARQPNNADVYYDLGITLRDKGEIDAAAAAYRKAIALNPQLWEAHNNLGMLLHDLKSFDGAIAEYLEAKRLAPEESVVRNNLGNTYCDKGDYDAAITEFRELFRMDSGWQQGHSCLARALMSKRDYESAIVELRPLFCRIPPVRMSTATWGRRCCCSTGSRRRCANCEPRFSSIRIPPWPITTWELRFSTERISRRLKPSFARPCACNRRPTTTTTWQLA